MCFLIPRKTLRLAGREHGRAIPLADKCTAAKSSLFNHLVGSDEQLVQHVRLSILAVSARDYCCGMNVFPEGPIPVI